MPRLTANPERDPALGHVLRDVEEFELRSIDWNGLARQIMQAARGAESAPTWCLVMSDWLRVGLPLALAAGVVAVAVLGALRFKGPNSGLNASTPSALDFLVVRHPSAELRDSILGLGDAETYFAEAMRR